MAYRGTSYLLQAVTYRLSGPRSRGKRRWSQIQLCTEIWAGTLARRERSSRSCDGDSRKKRSGAEVILRRPMQIRLPFIPLLENQLASEEHESIPRNVAGN